MFDYVHAAWILTPVVVMMPIPRRAKVEFNLAGFERDRDLDRDLVRDFLGIRLKLRYVNHRHEIIEDSDLHRTRLQETKRSRL